MSGSNRNEPNRRDPDRPGHPTGQAIALLVAVTLLIIVLAAASTF